MPRIRTIKPDFWKHEDLSDLPSETHLMAAALLNYADDEGYFNANPKLVKAECCPLREDSTNIRRSLEQLASIGYIRLGKCEDGKNWGHIKKFLDHQRVDRPRDSKIKDLCIKWEDSTKDRRKIDEGSTPEGNGMEWNGSSAKADAEASLAERVWSEGLKTFSRISGKNEAQCRSLIGKWRKAHDDSAVLSVVMEAERQAVSDPAAWVAATLKARCPEGRSRVVDLYRQILVPTLPDVIDLDDDRKRQIGSLSNGQLNTMDQWERFFLAVADSPVLTGSKPWRNGDVRAVDFDFLLKHAVKIMEGKYDD